ncbi:unnamed protein product, partial [Plutella xylostella]
MRVPCAWVVVALALWAAADACLSPHHASCAHEGHGVSTCSCSLLHYIIYMP